jgi:hypothetical protein
LQIDRLGGLANRRKVRHAVAGDARVNARANPVFQM